MTQKIIELRSDTFTLPTESMRAAMAAAEVGDDVWDEDPTIHRLQRRAAEMVGKDASLFVPSGTMGNLCALLSHTQPHQHTRPPPCDPDRSQAAPKQHKSPQAAPSVVNVPELLSLTYQNRVRNPSPRTGTQVCQASTGIAR